jgi:hypothetical protein
MVIFLGEAGVVSWEAKLLDRLLATLTILANMLNG